MNLRTKNLYWVETKDGDENWFVIARDRRIARNFFEDFEGYNKREAKAYLICPVKKEYEIEHAYYAQLDMLEDLGFEVISENPARVVRKDGIIYREGLVGHTILFEVSEEKGAGVYIVRVSGTSKFKIGIAKNFLKRFRDLQTGSSDEIEPVHFYATHNYKKLEKYLHSKYKNKSLGREWFSFNSIDLESLHEDILYFIRNE